MAEVEVARISIVHYMDDDRTYVSVEAPDDMGMVEILGLLEMGKATELAYHFAEFEVEDE